MASPSQKVKLNPIDESCAETNEVGGRTPPFTIPADGAGVPSFEAMGVKDIMGATAPMPSRCTWGERAMDPGYSIEGTDNPIRHNPAVSGKQRRFMGAELARKREGKKTKTGMSESQLKDYATKE